MWTRRPRHVTTHLDVSPVHGDVGVPVGSVLLVLEAEGVEQLMHHHLEVDAPVLLQPDLHPPVPEPGTTCYLHQDTRPSGPPVGDNGVAASVAGHDVHIVHLDIVDIIIDMSRYNRYYLVSPLHESDAAVVLDVLHACRCTDRAQLPALSNTSPEAITARSLVEKAASMV